MCVCVWVGGKGRCRDGVVVVGGGGRKSRQGEERKIKAITGENMKKGTLSVCSVEAFHCCSES